MLTADETKAIIRRCVDESWNKGNLSIYDTYCDPAFTIARLDESEPNDLEGFKAFIAEYRAQSPNIHNQVEEIIVEGDCVAYTYVVQFMLKGEPKKRRGIGLVYFTHEKIVKIRYLSVDIMP